MIEKVSLKNTLFDLELQAIMYQVLLKHQDKTSEYISAELTDSITKYFEHIGCKFIISKSKNQNVKHGKLI